VDSAQAGTVRLAPEEMKLLDRCHPD